MSIPIESKLLLTVREIAELTSLSMPTIWRIVYSGTLPVVRIGRAVRIPREEFYAWLENEKRRAVVNVAG